jgi:hypothetical protein
MSSNNLFLLDSILILQIYMNLGLSCFLSFLSWVSIHQANPHRFEGFIGFPMSELKNTTLQMGFLSRLIDLIPQSKNRVCNILPPRFPHR